MTCCPSHAACRAVSFPAAPVLARRQHGISWLKTCGPKRNAQDENFRSFPHLRPCQTRQPRGTKQSSERGAGQNPQADCESRAKKRGGKKRRNKCQKPVKTRCLTSATTGLCTC